MDASTHINYFNKFPQALEEFPFLTDALKLSRECESHGNNRQITGYRVSRINMELLSRQLYFSRLSDGDGLFIPPDSHLCEQLFSVQDGIVKKVPATLTDIGEKAIMDELGMSPYAEWDELNGYHQLVEEKNWGIASTIEGDEDYLVLLEHRLWYEQVDTIIWGELADKAYYSRVITVYKPPRRCSLQELIKRCLNPPSEQMPRG